MEAKPHHKRRPKTARAAGLVAFMSCIGKPVLPPPEPMCPAAVAAQIVARAKHMTPSQVTEVIATVCAETRRLQVDPLVAVALMDLESGFDATVVSSRGATGLMQLMPPTALAVAKLHGSTAPADGLLNPAYNATLGISYLADLSREFRSPDRGLVAYNIGSAALYALLDKHGAAFDAGAHPFVIQVMQRRDALPNPTAPADSKAAP